jgi:hypothetical protein
MTVSSLTNRVSYQGTATINQAMSIPFPYLDDTDLVVIETVTATGAETTMVAGVDYGVIDVSSFLVTLVEVPAARTWTITRATPITQPTDYIENDSFPADSHETALDRATLIARDLQEQADRSIHFPPTESTSMSGELPNAIDRASTYLAFGADGSITASALTTGTASVSTYGQTLIDDTTAAAARDTLEIKSGASTARGVPTTAGITYLTTDSAQQFYDNGTDWVEVNGTAENLVTNGGMAVDQRVGPYEAGRNGDDVYTLDHIVLLSESADAVDVAQATGGPNGFGNHLTATVNAAGADEKFGFLFPIETKKCSSINYAGSTVSASCYVKTETLHIEKIKLQVLVWANTADAITSDVVNAWGAEGVQPTFATDWAARVSSNYSTLSNNWQRFEFDEVVIPSGTVNNIAVFIWVDDTDLDIGDVLYLTGVQLTAGNHSRAFKHRRFEEELAECKRYYQKSFLYGTQPAQSAGVANSYAHIKIRSTPTDDEANYIPFQVEMFKDPTVTLYSPGAATSDWWNVTEGTPEASGTSAIASQGTQGALIINAGAANDEVDDIMTIHYTAEGEM